MLLFYIIVIICNIIFLIGIKKNDLFYNCSDEITNEFLKNEKNNTKKTIIYGVINLILDIIAIIIFIIIYLKKFNIFEKLKKKSFSKNFENENNNNIGYINSNENLKSNIQNTVQEKMPIKDIKNEQTELAAKEDIN